MALARLRGPRDAAAPNLAVVVLLLVACASEAPESTPSQTALTRGPIPEPARLADGSIDLSQIPDFIPAADGWFFFSDDLGMRARDPGFSLVITPNDALVIETGR
ncbi:MAG: hypothetical protein M3406_02880 [Chloroflexota bacterium]|nr:hypothetical protein [Chloroflexota bacterium]